VVLGSRRWHISAGGEIVPREEVEISSPFITGGERLRIVSLDQDGGSLKIGRSTETVSISPGFRAPEFTLRGLDNEQYSSLQLKGKIVLLEFWSVSCPFCERILPEFNSLVKKESAKDFVALDIAREEDPVEIKSYLRAHPRDATVVVNDKATWQTYDGPVITPAFYLIDTRGVIRLAGYGASPEQLKVIERLIEQIRKGY
jgi:thiol-disulfide isomerase/thioredoxin